MQTRILRKVGASVMMAIPPSILENLDLRAGTAVSLSVDSGRLIVTPYVKPRYTMEELLAGSDYSEPQPPEEREWLDTPAVGRELI